MPALAASGAAFAERDPGMPASGTASMASSQSGEPDLQTSPLTMFISNHAKNALEQASRSTGQHVTAVFFSIL